MKRKTMKVEVLLVGSLIRNWNIGNRFVYTFRNFQILDLWISLVCFPCASLKNQVNIIRNISGPGYLYTLY